MTRIALTLFDLDHTLVPLDTHQEWIRFLADQGVPDRDELLKGARAMDERYRAGGDAVDVGFCEFFIGTLAALPAPVRQEWIARFVTERVAPAITPRARACVLEAQARGAVAIITATNRLLTTPVARALGIEHLIATEVECAAGIPTGKVAGIPCMRRGKLDCLERWLAHGHLPGIAGRADLGSLTFYSDSINDQPLLEAADRAIAVDPDPALAALAAARSWPVVSLR